MCGLCISSVCIGYRLGSKVKIMSLKSGDVLSVVDERMFEDEDATVPEVE